jgi:hypothetical protein
MSGGRHRYRTATCFPQLELADEPGVQVLGLPGLINLQSTSSLVERFGEGAADAHRLADGLHLRAEARVRTRELLEREARPLDDDVVERRLEARRRRAGQVVRDLVERVADRELRRDLRDRVAGRLRGERRGARNPRIHLDHAQLACRAVTRELDVRATRVHADGTRHRDCGVTELLKFFICERHLRRDRDGVAGVYAHRVEVLDRADDHDVVGTVAHDLQLELVPAAERLLDQDLPDRALRQAKLDLTSKLGLGRNEAAAVAAERERRADDGGWGQTP